MLYRAFNSGETTTTPTKMQNADENSPKAESTPSTPPKPPSPAQRGASRAKVTKSLTLLNVAVAERNPHTVSKLMPYCKSAIDECLRTCEAFTTADSPDNLEANEDYLNEILTKYATGMENANRYLEASKPKSPTPSQPNTPSPTPTHDSTSAQFDFKMEQLCDLLSMPETPLDIFDGNILEFNNWYTVYKERVGDKNVTPMVKLNKMLHAVQGEPYDLISFCKGLGGEEGYTTACEILLTTYDDPDAVCKAYTDNLKQGGKVSTPADFLRLAADLRSASAILTKHERITELQNQCVIKTIVLRLPNFAILKWRKIALNSKFDSDGKNQYPAFDKFVDFVVLLARESRDSTWGDLSELLAEASQSSTDSRGAHASINNVASRVPTQSSCFLCGSEHSIFQCVRFKQMSVDARVTFALTNRMCFRCLKTGHIAKECSSTYLCEVPGCGGRHSKFLHDGSRHNTTRNQSIQPSTFTPSNQTHQSTQQSNPSPSNHIRNQSTQQPIFTPSNQAPLQSTPTQPSTTPTENANSGTNSNSNMCVNAPCGTPGSKCVLLPMVPIHIPGHDKVEYALLDRGSQRTVCEQSLVDELQIESQPTNSTLEGLWGSNKVNAKVDFEIKSAQNGNHCNLDALIVPRVNARHPPKRVNISDYPYLVDLPIITGKYPKARILIGLDNAHLMLPYDKRHCGDETANTLFAEKTFLGWTLNGPLCDNIYCDDSSDIALCNNITLSFDDSRSVEHLEKLWTIENGESTSHTLAPDDEKVLKLWDNESKFIDNRWHVPIPWKYGKPNFENNVGVAIHLLNALVKRLQRDGLVELYDKAVQKLINKNYVEMVPDHELNLNDGTVRYLPHFHDKKRTKDGNLRIIMDAKHKVRGVSFNNQCLQGPNYVNNLTHIMLRLRQYQYIVKGDIEGMYMQIRLFPEDRRSLRFLWYDNQGNVIHLQYRAHIFGGIASGSAAGYVLDRACRHGSVSELLKTTIRRDFYVDDLATSKRYKQEIKEIINEGGKLLKENGLNLTEFVVNDSSIADELDSTCKAPEMIDFHSTDSTNCYSKTLGVRLDIKADAFIYINYPQQDGTDITKRIVLSKVHKLFDPLGLITPVSIKGRVIFQDITRLKQAWDTPVPPDIAFAWNEWLGSLTGLEELRFSRCLLPEAYADGVSELIHFSDASRQAYGACTYMRTITHEGKIKVDLLMSRARVAPLKEHSIARLELCGALEAVRLDRYLKETMDIPFVLSTFFVDSKIALAYIYNDSKRYSVFIAHRVREIRETTQPSQWHYIQTKLNPADIITHGCNGDGLTDLWVNGPTFLYTYRSEWKLIDIDPKLTEDAEVIHDSAYVNVCSSVAQKTRTVEFIERYSSCYRLKRATAWLRRFISFVSNKKTCVRGPLTVQEINNAELALIRYVQISSFRKEIECLCNGKDVPRKSSLLTKDPMLQNELLVVGGRLLHSNLPENSKHRVILPKNHHFSKLIITEYHNVGHTGIEWTLNAVNQRFYIVGARNMLKVVRSRCIECRKLHARHVEQRMSDLPPERTMPFLQPFAYSGLDVFGPFRVKQGRAEIKRYGLVLACFNTRGIHIEMLQNLDTDSFLNGLVRFIARRSKPIKIFSDNGTNIVGGYNELMKAWKEVDQKKLSSVSKSMGIEWDFNVPLASHQGGVYERMIRTVRRVLESMINPHTRLTDDVLQTFFCQVEYIVNSRPLTKVSDDPLDETALCPNHLLVIGSYINFPVGTFREADKYRRQWRYVQFLVDHFWKRWVREYLPMLCERPKWQKLRNNVKVGDLILLEDTTVGRYCWPLARVTKVNQSRTDDLVRSLELRSQGRNLVRPITKVVLLEGAISSDDTEEER